MRLIYAQAVINLITDIQYDDRYINNNEVFVALETVRDCVFNLPTAYDVDKVVGEINEKSWEYMSDFGDTRVIDFVDAIDIVRRGVV